MKARVARSWAASMVCGGGLAWSVGCEVRWRVDVQLAAEEWLDGCVGEGEETKLKLVGDREVRGCGLRAPVALLGFRPPTFMVMTHYLPSPCSTSGWQLSNLPPCREKGTRSARRSTRREMSRQLVAVQFLT